MSLPPPSRDEGSAPHVGGRRGRSRSPVPAHPPAASTVHARARVCPVPRSSQPPIQLAAGRRARRQRRHPVDGEPRAGRGRVRRVARRDRDRGDRRAGGRGAVDGRRRVRVGQLAARRRAGRHPPGGARASPRPAGRAARARRRSTSSGAFRRRWRARSRRPCRAAARWRRTPATSSASTSSDWPGRSRPRGRRRCRSRRGRRCRCSPSRRRRQRRGSASPWP